MKHLIVTGTLVGLLALSLTGCNTSSNATTSSSSTSASSSSSSASSSAVQAMSQLEQELDTTGTSQETPDSSTITEEPESSPFSSVTPYTMYANTVVAIRLTPEDNAKESQNIQTNEKVTVIEEGSGDKIDWCKVKLESGTESYILKKWLSAEPISIPESNESQTSSTNTNSGNTNSTPATPTPEPEPEPEPVPEPTPEPTTDNNTSGNEQTAPPSDNTSSGESGQLTEEEIRITEEWAEKNGGYLGNHGAIIIPGAVI